MGRRPSQSLDPDAIVPWLISTFNRSHSGHVLSGVGEDDCGVVRLGRTIAVISADFLNATPIIEQLGLGAEREMGRIAVAATLADLIGSGAYPRALLVAITVPYGYPERLFKDLMLGVRLESRRWRVPVIAGDTKLGQARAVLTCAVGTANSTRELFLANRARPGDIILTSGRLGTCAAATSLGSRGTVLPRWARRAITTPELPIHRSRALAKLRIANAGIDISDGLAADLRRLGEASKVGAVLHADKIPVDSHVAAIASREGVPPWAFSFASGGDFQFIVTVPRHASPRAEKLGFSKIGVITKKKDFWIEEQSGTKRYKLPHVGHKDRRGQKFAGEIRQIISEITRG